MNTKHLAVFGRLQSSGMFLTDVIGCSTVRADSGIINGDSASITDPASLTVS